jgi:hypothetical protein
MTHYLSNITESLKAYLPQNTHTQKAASLTQEICSLENSLKSRTDSVFQSKVIETIQAISQEKEKSLQALDRMNGSYYQDPQSKLKINWDKLVVSVKTALGTDVERFEQLPKISSQLETAPASEQIEDAKRKVHSYQFIEKKRNDRQAQLERIVAIQKGSTANTDEQLRLKKESLLKEYRELSGDYFGDPKGKLDQAWRKYQTAIQHGSTGEHSLTAYENLEKQRKQIEAKLYSVEQLLATPSTPQHTYETLTTLSIARQIEDLKRAQTRESGLSGIDWKGIAATAATTTLLTAGYFLQSQGSTV